MRGDITLVRSFEISIRYVRIVVQVKNGRILELKHSLYLSLMANNIELPNEKEKYLIGKINQYLQSLFFPVCASETTKNHCCCRVTYSHCDNLGKTQC